MKKYLTRKNSALVALLIALLSVAAFLPQSTIKNSTTLTRVLSDASNHKILSADLNDANRVITITYKDLKTPPTTAVYPYTGGPYLTDKLIADGVQVSFTPLQITSPLSSLINTVIPFLLIGVVMLLVLRYYGKGQLSMGKASSAVERPTTRLADFAGADEIRDELSEIIIYLNDPESFKASGALVPKGVLLDGEPGTGKTLLARAVAGEANVPFFAVSGSDFVEMFVGRGAARVRELFAAAKKLDRAIVFIDEVDAIGRRRSQGFTSPAEREIENTLNQLLVELDGFHGSHVVVLASTNRPELLDPALVRPGRFDRKITIPMPDLNSRLAILQLHSKKLTLDEKVVLANYAKRTQGMSGADLANLLNTAALLAARASKKIVSDLEINEALAQVVMGRARKGAHITERDRSVTAWHEAGHAVVALLSEDHPDPVQVTIIPRGQAGGVTWMHGIDDSFSTRSELLTRIRVSMAGRAGEELHLNGSYTQGAASDLAKSTEIATHMITQWGMSGASLAVRDQLDPLKDPEISRQVNEILLTAHSEAHTMLLLHSSILEEVAAQLLERETLTTDDLHRIRQELTQA